MNSASWTSGTNWACAVVTAVIGLCCFGGAIYLFSAAGNNQRELLVREYDGAIAYWKAKGRSQFKGVTCTVSNLTGSGGYALAASTTPEKLRDSSQTELTTYTPLSYTHTGNIAPGLEWNKAGKWQTDLTFTCSGGTATKASTVTLPKLALYETRIFQLSNQKQCMYQRKGSYRNGRCEVYYKAKEICIKMSLVGGQWALNNTWGGYGC